MAASHIQRPTVYRVVLKAVSFEPRVREAVHAALLEHAGCSEPESRRILESLPISVASGVTEEHARTLAAALTRAGADVEVSSPPIAAPVLRPAVARAERYRRTQAKNGWYLVVPLAVLAVAVWLASPGLRGLRLEGKEGQVLRYHRSLELEQLIQRGEGSLEVTGGLSYGLERTVRSVSSTEIVVEDRFHDVSAGLIATGAGREAYESAVDRMQSLMNRAEIVRTFSRKGKLAKSEGEDDLIRLESYPSIVEEALGEISFPPQGVKDRGTWVSAIDLERGIQFTLDLPEPRRGVLSLPAVLETVPLRPGTGSSIGFAGSRSETGISGRVWFDAEAGWPVELKVELTHVDTSNAAGIYLMGRTRARVTQVRE